MNIKKIALAIMLGLTVPALSWAGKGPEWLKKAVFYQIYPSTYMDSNGDGMGDLNGITSRLDYIKSIGVNVIWLNPIYVSGWTDGGYDIIDYYKVDPRFGTNTDLVNLVNEAHKRGFKVVLDLVAGHTSNRCPWFLQSAEADPNQHYSNYYVWTNTISQQDKDEIVKRHQEAHPEASFTGRYVEANAPRDKYYLKNFFESQPALNYGFYNIDPNSPWEEPMDAAGPMRTREELKNIMAFWISKGADGFRVDMAHSLVKNDPQKIGVTKLWKEMRDWYDTNYPEHVLIAEWSNPAIALPAGFSIDFFIHFGIKGYPSLFFAKNTPHHQDDYDQCYFNLDGKGQLKQFMDNYIDAYNKTKDIGYISLPTSNHDFQRPNVGTRNTLQQLEVAMTFFLTQPGCPFIYYGDEIAMKYTPNLPNKEGSTDRSGSRTPMQWSSGATAGFSTCTPDKLYLPVDTENGKITVESEEKDPKSMLNFVRDMLKLRLATNALGNEGEWKMLSDVNKPYPLVYQRTDGNETYVVAINPSGKKVQAAIDSENAGKNVKVIRSVGKGTYRSGSKSDQISLDAVSAVIFKVK